MKNILEKFKVDDSTYLLVLIALLAGYFKNVVLLMLIVGVHEFGHIVFFLIFHIDIEKVIFYPFGGMTIVNKKIHERIYKDFLCAVGGVFFQVLLFVPMYFLYENVLIGEMTYKLFLLYNKRIFMFNVLPIIPLDGSKALLCCLTKLFSFRKSYKLMIGISTIILLLFIIYNLYFKLNDLFIYVFLIMKLVEVIREYKYVINNFYLERMMYHHYYNGIVNSWTDVNSLKLDKYYFFKEGNHYINEKDYIKNYYYM